MKQSARPLGSTQPFEKMGVTPGLTYLDDGSGTSAWQYEVTPWF